jgi:ligand-binding SRPBCC domain-containing protein
MKELFFQQKLPISMDEAWSFFSSPGNLQKITPSYMEFEIISSHHGDNIYAGQIIRYIVKPIMGVPLKWCTEITHVSDKQYFVDEQRFGPYSFWHHQHHFHPADGGVLMVDILHYKLPFGFLGNIAGSLFVDQQVREIFSFRKQRLIQLFGA